MSFEIDWSQYPDRLYELLTGAMLMQHNGHVEKARKLMNQAYAILDKENKTVNIRYAKGIGRITLINN